MHDRLRNALLGRWGRFVASHPVLTLLACGLLTAAALAVTYSGLEFRSDRSDLIDPDLAWNRRYALYKERFQRWNDLIVCVEGPADDDRIDAMTRDLAAALAGHERVVSADAGFGASETGPRLFAAAPDAIFDELLDRIAAGRVIANAANVASLIAALGARDADAGTDVTALEPVLAPTLTALSGGTPDFTGLRPAQPRWLPLVSSTGSGRIRFVYVQMAETTGRVDDVSSSLQWLRDEIGRFIDARDGPSVTWGVTGIPAIEADETAQSIHDSTIASILAFGLITLLMIAVFRGIVVPLLAAGSLLVGMSWSFGWLVLSVGHLQLLSVVFSVILLGLGVDFALHLVARLELVQDEHDDLPSAISRVFRGIGPGMLTGAVTTAAAFAATALTKFKGMAEMGIIACGGILLCLVAVLSVFPAALGATGRWKRIIRHRPGGERARFAGGRLDVVDFHPRITFVATLGVLVAMALLAVRVQYDPNVLNLHPPGIESVEWEHRIVEDDARSIWGAFVETDADAAPRLVDRFRALPEVSDVGAMGLLVRPDRVERAARIAAVRESALPVPALPPDYTALRSALTTLRDRLDAASTNPDDPVMSLVRRTDDAIAASHALTAEAQEERMATLAAAFLPMRDELAAWIDIALLPTPLGPEDLPSIFREQWSDGGEWLLEIYPTADPAGRSILEPDLLRPFVLALRSVDPTVLGPAVQIYESSELIKREYIKAAAYAVAAILLLLLFDFRSLADTLCAMLPVMLGFVGMFGLMGLAGVPLNFANIIVMPLIFGIGVDAGVHVIHRWRAEPYGRPAGLSGGTGRGITLTMMSTMIGFGCMMIAEHRGIRSLGFVMVAGLGVCLLGCYTTLPAILRMRTG